MTRPSSVALALLGCVFFGAAASGGGLDPAFIEEAKLTVSESIQLFGTSVAVSGDTVLVTAPGTVEGGAAYVFVRSGGAWTLQQRLTPPDAAGDNYFGASASLSGDTAVIGDYSTNLPGAVDAGAAYVFVRSGTAWTLQQKLTAPDAAAFDLFGGAVTVFGDTAVIGSTKSDAPGVTDAGAVYVFSRSGTTWSLQKKVTASNAATDDNFGGSVSLFQDTFIVGAEGVDVGTEFLVGAAYVFVKNSTEWTEQQVIPSPRGLTFDLFGGAVSVHRDTAAVTARQRKGGRGAVDVFVRSGSVWTRQQEITASDSEPSQLFGTSVSLYGQRLAVGAYATALPGALFAGAAYVYERAGTTWTERQKLTASDFAEEDSFGDWVAASPDLVVVGAFADDTPAGDDTGSAYVFRRSPARYFPLTPCRAVDTAASGAPLAANTTRTFAIAGQCGVPADASAVATILVAVVPSDSGHLTLYPAGQPLPTASMMNFTAGRTRHGNGVVSLGSGGQVDVTCRMPPGSVGETHFILDVVGYFK